MYSFFALFGDISSILENSHIGVYISTVVKVDGATPKRWISKGGHDTPIRGSCAIYFAGGIWKS